MGQNDVQRKLSHRTWWRIFLCYESDGVDTGIRDEY